MLRQLLTPHQFTLVGFCILDTQRGRIVAGKKSICRDMRFLCALLACKKLKQAENQHHEGNRPSINTL